MTRFEITQRAGEGETFAPQAFDGSIGKTVPLKVEGRRVGETRMIAAEVSADRKAVRLTFETNDAGDLLSPPPVGDFSIGRRLDD